MLITLREDVMELGKFRSRNSKTPKGEKMSSRGLDSESWACVGDLGEQNSPISQSEERVDWVDGHRIFHQTPYQNNLKPESYIFKMD